MEGGGREGKEERRDEKKLSAVNLFARRKERGVSYVTVT